MKNKDIMLSRFQCLRKESGFSVDRLPSFAAYIHKTIQNLKMVRQKHLTIDAIARLSLIFDVSSDYLLGFTNNKSKSILLYTKGISDRDLFKKIQLLSNDEIEEIKKMIE